jgi:hypothetical protein
MPSADVRREIDVARVRALAAASGGRIGIVTLPVAGRPRFMLELAYATAGSKAYPGVRQSASRIAIDLAPRHPFEPPLTTVLTPIFHPHVFPSGLVCIGTKWLPSEGMDLFVQRVVRLLAFDPLLMNPHSIANAAAASWYQAALRRYPTAFPTDPAALAWPTVDATPEAGAAASERKSAGDTAAATERVLRRCPHCHAALRLPSGGEGTVRCPRCSRDFHART